MEAIAEREGTRSEGTVARAGKYLSFSLSGEGYGLPILKVKEIIGMMPITPIPQAPEYVKGVINLRGKVIPILELRRKFGLQESDITERTCIIVVEVEGQSGRQLIGNIVDSVSEVLNIKIGDIEATPTFAARSNTDFILGMAKIGSTVKILLDIEKVLSSEEIICLQDAA
jgi:purine-binding chemotaxis protein CheW